MNGLTVCLSHGGKTRQAKAKAARLLNESAYPAVITLQNILLSEDTDDALKVKTAIALLDRVPGIGRNAREEQGTPLWALTLNQVSVTHVNREVPAWVLEQAEGVEPPQRAIEQVEEAEVVEDDDFEPSDHSNVISFDTPIVRGSANPPRRR
ncbi:hypothetical protein [Leifsonia xyli]|uniref:hypothetical protein n=1 Tax=Leifsonia xyli TaxID=1575 RepID=UPI003D663BF7